MLPAEPASFPHQTSIYAGSSAYASSTHTGNKEALPESRFLVTCNSQDSIVVAADAEGCVKAAVSKQRVSTLECCLMRHS
jgi:hypothetical protein